MGYVYGLIADIYETEIADIYETEIAIVAYRRLRLLHKETEIVAYNAQVCSPYDRPSNM